MYDKYGEYIIDESGKLKYLGDGPISAGDAWRLTLKKWEIIFRNGNRITDEGSHDTDGLCMRYYAGGNKCRGCPVAIESGAPLCERTPYFDYALADDIIIDSGVRTKQLFDERCRHIRRTFMYLRRVYRMWLHETSKRHPKEVSVEPPMLDYLPESADA